MNNLFIIVGAAGVGKSAITNYIRQKVNHLAAQGEGERLYNVIKKHTTRPIRKEEINADPNNLDLIFSKEKEFIRTGNVVYYLRNGYKYWCTYNQIKEAAETYKNNFIITTGIAEAEEIKENVKGIVNCVIVYVYADTNAVNSRMVELDYTKSDIERRTHKTLHMWGEFLNIGAKTINHTILNISSLQDLYTQVDNIVDIYNV